LTGQDLGGLTLTPGVYFFSSSAALTGTLKLDGDGRFDFLIGSTLTTAAGAPSNPGSSVVLEDGAQACHVFWQVGSSATIGTYCDFVGTILADTSITLDTGASLSGRALALNGAVTLDDNLITVPICVPESATFWSGAFCASIFGWQWLALWRRKACRS
jgi:type VI secretion system secreted protein VgrG